MMLDLLIAGQGDVHPRRLLFSDPFHTAANLTLLCFSGTNPVGTSPGLRLSHPMPCTIIFLF